MARNVNLSEYWRVNKSSIEYVELANSLKALRKVVGYLGLDAEVIWTGMTSAREDRIELSPILALGEYPIPAENMDVLVGFAIHQALHLTENSWHALRYISQRFREEEQQRLLQQLVETGEDIHVDGTARKREMLGKYVQKSRAWWRRNNPINPLLGTPAPERLFETWASVILDSIFPNTVPESLEALQRFSEKEETNLELLIETLCSGDKALELELYGIFLSIPSEYEEPLQMLLAQTQKIVEGDSMERALCYSNLWSKLEEHFAKWNKEAEEREVEEMKDESASEKLADELPPEIAEAVSQALASDAQDITNLIESSLKSVGEERKWLLFPTVYKHSTKSCKTPPDSELARRLREIFRLQREETLRMSRGLKSGKLDGRRLYRVPTTGLSFKRKESIRDNKWNIAVLLDASGSMMANWGLIESIYATLAEAWREYNNLEMLAYAESHGTCTVTRLFHNGSLFATIPAGNTPSGQAIIAAALLMPKGSRRLILHITDGLLNMGVDISFALKFCQREKIDLVTLGCGAAVSELRAQYGDSFEPLVSIEWLPSVLEALLRRKLLGRGTGVPLGARAPQIELAAHNNVLEEVTKDLEKFHSGGP